jgi:hypothetical protein
LVYSISFACLLEFHESGLLFSGQVADLTCKRIQGASAGGSALGQLGRACHVKQRVQWGRRRKGRGVAVGVVWGRVWGAGLGAASRKRNGIGHGDMIVTSSFDPAPLFKLQSGHWTVKCTKNYGWPLLPLNSRLPLNGSSRRPCTIKLFSFPLQYYRYIKCVLIIRRLPCN